MTQDQKKEIYYLLNCLCEGIIKDDEFDRLEELLNSDRQVREMYVDFISLWSDLRTFQMSVSPRNDGGISSIQNVMDTPYQISDTGIWEALLKAEKEYSALEIAEEPEQEAVVGLKPSNKKPSRFYSIYNKIVYAAAVLMFVLIVYNYVFPPKYTVEVATVSDQIGVLWGNSSETMDINDRVLTNQPPFILDKGLVKLEFDDGVNVLIEGPAEFMVERKGLSLTYGKLYSHVYETGRGFTVDTPNTRFIDLGTEFCVLAEKNKSSELHVLKGEVQYFYGLPGANKSSKIITENNARRFDGDSGEVQAIPVANTSFVRHLDSKSGFIWRGRNRISLVNILSGNIFTASPDGVEINPVTGEYVTHEDYVSGIERSGGLEYQEMDSPFIDGTFVPQGGQPQVITSTQLKWQAPKTSGLLHYNLSDRKIIYDGVSDKRYNLSLKDDPGDSPSLLMHPNMGLTLDLGKIRKEITGMNIVRFSVRCGIADAMDEVLSTLYPDGKVPELQKPEMAFIVLLDGKECKTERGISLESGARKIDIEIDSEARFLTLAATDGNQSFVYDWFFLEDPVLVIESQ